MFHVVVPVGSGTDARTNEKEPLTNLAHRREGSSGFARIKPGLWEWDQADAIVYLTSRDADRRAFINDKDKFANAARDFSASRHGCAEILVNPRAAG